MAFFFGGYLVTLRVDWPPERSDGLMPARLLSASGCIAPFAPDSWSYSWVEMKPEARRTDAAAFGIDDANLPAAMAVFEALQSAGQIGWGNTLVTAEAVRSALQLIPKRAACVVLGLGLHERHLPALLADLESPSGPAATVARKLPMPEGGNSLGFELLGMEEHFAHSWLCNGLESEFAKRFGTRPSPSGFLAEQDAETCASVLVKDEIGAEPVLWLPWLISDFTRSFVHQD